MNRELSLLNKTLICFIFLGFYAFYGIGFAKTNFIIKKRESIQVDSEAKAHLVIATTSDLHGWISTKTLYPKEKRRGLAHVVPLIKKLRQTHPNLILLDGGDTLQGSPDSYYFTYVSKSKSPLPIIRLMNQQKYDAVVLGNHDLELPLGLIKYNLQQSHFHWLAANLVHLGRTSQTSSFWSDSTQSKVSEQRGTLLSPYHVIERNGVRIGILGLLTPGTSMWVNRAHMKGAKLESMVSASKKWVAVLRNEEQVDVLIGLFHSGHNYKYDQFAALNQKVELPNAAGVIADQIEGFDLIISGHAHRTYPKMKNTRLRNFRTPLISPGAWGNGISVIQLFLQEKKRRWSISQMQFEFMPSEPLVAETNRSGGQHTLMQTEIEQVKNYLNIPTPVQFYAIPNKNQFYECGANLSHHVTKALTKRQGSTLLSLSLLPGRWRWYAITQEDLETPVKRLHLFRWIPYDNTLIQSNLFGRQIKILLEPYIRLKKGRKFPYNSLLAPGGLILTLENDHSIQIQLQGSDTSMLSDGLYPVWMTNYHWNGGGGMRGKALIHTSQKIRSIQNTLRDLVFEHLQNHPDDLPNQCKTFLRIN